MKLTKETLLHMRIKQMRELVTEYKVEGAFSKESRARPTEYRMALFTALVRHKVPACVICGTACKLQSSLEYHVTCGTRECFNRNTYNQTRKSLEQRYGVANASQVEGVAAKKIATCRKNYGCDHPAQSKTVRARARATSIERYGVANPSQAESVQRKRNATFADKFGGNPFANEEVKQKIVATNRQRLGVSYPSQAATVRRKIRASVHKKFGVDAPAQSEVVKAKMRATSTQRYGTPHPMQNATVAARARDSWKSVDRGAYRQKVKDTSLLRYGVEHHTKRDDYLRYIRDKMASQFSPQEIAEKRQAAGAASKDAWHNLSPAERQEKLAKTFVRRRVYAAHDVSKLLPLQGYEAKFVDRVYELNPTARFGRPAEINYADGKRYFPDVAVLLGTKVYIVEVKSAYTLTADLEKNLTKFRAADRHCRSLGETFQIVVLHKEKWYRFSWRTLPKTPKALRALFN